MSQIVYDGDFTQAQIAGPPEFEIPFKDDPKPYAYKLAYWQFLNSFNEPAFDDPGPIGGFYVGGSPGTFKTIGGGVIEFRREYALVPDTRNEWESFTYTYQFVTCKTSGGDNPTTTCSIAEAPLVVPSRIQFDYFHTDHPETDIDLPKARKAIQVGDTIFELDGFGTPATEFLAQDSTFKRWRGHIYERQQRFVSVLNGVNF